MINVRILSLLLRRVSGEISQAINVMCTLIDEISFFYEQYIVKILFSYLIDISDYIKIYIYIYYF